MPFTCFHENETGTPRKPRNIEKAPFGTMLADGARLCACDLGKKKLAERGGFEPPLGLPLLMV